jgi:hypothetical protein
VCISIGVFAQKTEKDLIGVWEAKVFKDSAGVKGITATRYEFYESGAGMAYYYDPLAGEMHPDHIMITFQFKWSFQPNNKQVLFMPNPDSGIENMLVTVSKFKRRKSMALWEHDTKMTEYFIWK